MKCALQYLKKIFDLRFKMRSFLLALLGSVSPKNSPNEVTNQELLDKINALTYELNEVKNAQTQSNVHF